MVRLCAEAHSKIDYLTAADREANACVSLERQTKADCADKNAGSRQNGRLPAFLSVIFFVIGLI